MPCVHEALNKYCFKKMNEGDTGRAQYSKADYVLLNSRRHIHRDVNGTFQNCAMW